MTRSGHQRLHRQRLLLLPQRQAQREHLVQQPQRRRQGQAEAEPDRRPRRRPDRDPRAVRRPQQGVLLRQLTKQFRQPSDTTRAPHHAERRPPRPATSPTARRRSTCWSWRPATARSSTLDPTIGKMLADIAGRHGRRIDRRRSTPTSSRFTFNVPVESKRIYPTFRLDYNLTHDAPRVVLVQLPEVHRLSRTRSTTATPVTRASRSKPARSRCV